MNSQQQLHQLVNKEQELTLAWQEAAAEVENTLRDYNDKQMEELNNLRTDNELVQAVADMVDKAKSEGQVILKQSQKDLKTKTSHIEDNYRQKQGIVVQAFVEEFKNKYRQ